MLQSRRGGSLCSRSWGSPGLKRGSLLNTEKVFAFADWEVVLCWIWRLPPPRFLGVVWVLDVVGGSPRSPLRGFAESGPPAKGLGGSPSAAGGLRRRRYEQPGPAVPDPGLARALAAAPNRAPPGAPARVPVPARAALHRGIAAPPSNPRAPACSARGSTLRVARRRPPLCPPRLARALAHAH